MQKKLRYICSHCGKGLMFVGVDYHARIDKSQGEIVTENARCPGLLAAIRVNMHRGVFTCKRRIKHRAKGRDPVRSVF